MNELNEEKFRKFWEETKLIRTYRARLPSYEDIELPYVFLSPHPNLKRVFVKKGKIHIKKPMIIIPGRAGRARKVARGPTNEIIPK